MEFLKEQIPTRMLCIISLVLSTFIIYPKIMDMPRELSYITEQTDRLEHILFFYFRYLFFCLLTCLLLYKNLNRYKTLLFAKRLLQNFAITIIAYSIYVGISLIMKAHADFFTGLLLFQFLVTCLICSFAGHFFLMYSEQQSKEHEIERLRNENLQSRCDALANQINPHFFFNSLNGLATLVRNNKKTQTLEYVDQLSEVFRYILQSDKKGIVELREELEFLDAFRYLQETRYADKLSFSIKIPEKKKNMMLPVLSLLPLIENIVKHNMIDSENRMCVYVLMNNKNELVVTNPIHTKIDQEDKSGVGLANLADRFELLLNKKIRIENDDKVFSVYLPLINYKTQ